MFNIYVNGLLKSSDTITTPGVAIGVSTDSASIGYSIYDAGAGYPYAFNGIVDDIRLYNRALSDSEVVHLDPFLSVKNAVVPANNIFLFPNPAKSQLTVVATDKISSIVISNTLGQTVSRHEYNATQVTLDIANFPAGVYFVNINGTDVKNFVKE